MKINDRYLEYDMKANDRLLKMSLYDFDYSKIKATFVLSKIVTRHSF